MPTLAPPAIAGGTLLQFPDGGMYVCMVVMLEIHNREQCYRCCMPGCLHRVAFHWWILLNAIATHGSQGSAHEAKLCALLVLMLLIVSDTLED
jgi:hypothetical protein